MKSLRCQRIARLLGQFCNPLRINLLCILSHKSGTIKELAKLTGAELSNISQHLKIMELSGLIKKERRGKFIICSIKDKRVLKLLDCLENYF